MIELLHITKRFGAVEALADVSFTIDRGQVHGLLGENGAGKSTLMNILFGLLRPDAGAIRLAGREVHIRSPRTAHCLGIGMVHQHFKLVPTLTVAQNCALFLRIPVRAAQVLAQSWLDRLQWQVPLQPPVERLTVGQQQRLEIIKALLAIEQAGGGEGAGGGSESKGTLILDEPTAVLTPQEIAELFAAIRTLRAAGTGVIFISHKLTEVRQICDAITILRRGRVIHTGPASGLSSESMAEMMVGAKVDLPRLAQAAVVNAPPILELRSISAGLLRDANLLVHPGQIVGIAGVDGNGQADLIRTIVDTRRPAAGILRIAGHDAADRTARWRADHVAYIPEDRQHDALILPLSIEDNLLLKNYRDAPYAALRPIHWLRFGCWRRRAADLVTRFDVRCRSVKDPVGRLSGGNQQKVVVARELSAWKRAAGRTQVKPLVVAVNPTRGLDVAATAFVMQQLLNARSAGAGVLLVHSDLDELLAIADRLFVIFSGRLMATRWPATTREIIGRMMLGLDCDVVGGAA